MPLPRQEEFRAPGAFALDHDSPPKPSASLLEGPGSGKAPYWGSFVSLTGTPLAFKSRGPDSSGVPRRKRETMHEGLGLRESLKSPYLVISECFYFGQLSP